MAGPITDLWNRPARDGVSQSGIQGNLNANNGSFNNINIERYYADRGHEQQAPQRSRAKSSTSIHMPTSCLFNLLQFLAEADSYAMRKEAALARKAKALRKRLEVIIDNIDPDQFLKTLLVVDQTVQRPRVEPLEFDHPRFYWIFKNMDYHQ
jgi:hypothetical protein